MPQVGTEHVLLGMIAHAEEHDDKGSDGSALFGGHACLGTAETEILRMSGRRKRRAGPGVDLPFTRNAQSVFEAALEVYARRGCLLRHELPSSHSSVAVAGASFSCKLTDSAFWCTCQCQACAASLHRGRMCRRAGAWAWKA